MKKLIAWILMACMMTGCALAGEEVKGSFTGEELTGYVSNVLDMFMNSDNVNGMDIEGMPCYEMDGDSVFLILDENEELAGDANVYQIGMNELPDIRGIRRGDSVNVLFEKYPNDNPSLKGTEYAALLYMEGDLVRDGVVRMGYVSREKNRIAGVYYAELTALGEGMPVNARMVIYAIEHDMIADVIYCDTEIEREEAEMLIEELTDAQESGLYQPAIDSGFGSESEIFGREDLYFSGLDMVGLTYEDVVAQYGEPDADEMLKDEEAGVTLRVADWGDNFQIIFVYDADGHFVRTHSVRIYGADFEGPRGVKVGDSVVNTMERFYHEEDAGMLYGNGHDLPWAQLQTTDTAVTLVYACEVEGQTAVLHMTFCNDMLNEILVTLE